MACFSVCFAALMYAIVGGPSSGKTSIIKELEKRGELVIHEAATDLILSKISAGLVEPWKEESFALEVLQLELERETPCHSIDGRVFVDRGLFDVYTFAMFNKLAGTQTLASINQILDQIDLKQHYKAIFFVQPHSVNFSPLQTEVRSENAQEAAKLEVATYAIYCRHPNFILVPGELSPDERADFLLKKMDEIYPLRLKGAQSKPIQSL